ncbi:hypothetical protein GCM10022255_014050 [Dactylosporangium darangshiense]|uniref:Monooxygenase n=1 Tax=Dactylosporangium darangshiense TaxID=579108 RepID=A0ABP8D0L4_9ACTN
MRAIVVGGGIGGLATARGLALRGWDVTVLERQPTLEAAGAGLSLWPNALLALDWLGLGDRVRAAGAPITGGGLRTASGTWLTRVRMTAPPVDAPSTAHPVTAPHPAGGVPHGAGGAAHLAHPAHAAGGVPHPADAAGGVPHAAGGAAYLAHPAGGASDGGAGVGAGGPIVVHRADLHEILADGLEVRTGAEVRDVRELDADLIVGADGIGSVVRAAYAPQVRIRDSGQVSWRAVVPAEAMGGALEGGETMGPGGLRFGHVPMGRRGVYWYAAAPAPLRTDAKETQLDQLRRAFGGWHVPIPALLAATDPATLLHHPLLDLHPVAPMRFGARTALVGDAAHAMTPNLGQGACQALEDAVTLAGFVPAGDTGRDGEVEAALRRYDAERRPRVALVARRSWQVGRVAGARGAVASAVVRTLARLTPASATTRGAERIAAWTPPTPSPVVAPAGPGGGRP